VFGTPLKRQASSGNSGGSTHASASGALAEDREYFAPAHDFLFAAQLANRAPSVTGRTRMCTICMDYVAAPKACTLPCSHAFHMKCVSEMREFGVREVCPMCRKRVGDESQPGQELFEEGCRSFVPLKRRVERGEAVWDSLSTLQQREMDTASSLWRKAAKLGLPAAQCSLGLVHRDGRGVAQSDGDALAWFEEAATQGHANALFNVALLHRDGRAGAPASDEEAAIRFLAAAEKGHAEAQFSLGTACLKGLGVPKSERNAMRWYQRAATQGHAKAQFNLGCLYQLFGGFGDQGGDSTFAKDDETAPLPGREAPGLPQGDGDATAVHWYRKAAEQGHPAAQFNLGCMCEDGVGVLRASDAEAAHWYRKAADQGHSKAQFNLGCLLERGGLRSGSNNHNPVAGGDSGGLYRDISGGDTAGSFSDAYLGTAGGLAGVHCGSSLAGGAVPVGGGQLHGADAEVAADRGLKDAAEWYRRAGAQGHAGALFNLGLLYEHGRGVPRDHGKALALLCEAAAEGHEEAQQQARKLKSPSASGTSARSGTDAHSHPQTPARATSSAAASAASPSGASAGGRSGIFTVRASGRPTASRGNGHPPSKSSVKAVASSRSKAATPESKCDGRREGRGSSLDGNESGSHGPRSRTSSLDRAPPPRDAHAGLADKRTARPQRPKSRDGRAGATAEKVATTRVTQTSTTVATTTTTTVISLEIGHEGRGRGRGGSTQQRAKQHDQRPSSSSAKRRGARGGPA
jgi:hypothetical protein